MNLTISNLGSKSTVLSVVDGAAPGVQELEPGLSASVNGECTVVIVGDKPDLAEQLGQAADIFRALRDKLASQTITLVPVLMVGIINHGQLPVRAILGDGVTDEEIAPGITTEVACKGYIELRELGHVQQSDDPAQQPGNLA